MSEYQAEYRCRRCGDTFLSGLCTDSSGLARDCIARFNGDLAPEDEPHLAPPLYRRHLCPSDLGIGIADFIGWQKTVSGGRKADS